MPTDVLHQAGHDGPADLAGMQELAARLFGVSGHPTVGELAWNYALSYDRPAENPTAVWRAAGQVAAWGWLERPAGLMLQVDPGRPGLADEVLDWAEQAAAGPLTVDVASTELPVISALTRRGYTGQDGPFFSRLALPLADGPRPRQLPAGYRIRAMAGDRDAEHWVAVHCLAFPGSRFDAARRRRLTGVPPYRRDFDLVAEAPDGTFAAYCLGWYDELNATGEFEPVGAHPGHRGLGLASAVCIAVLHQFRAAGGRRAIVNARGDAAYPAPLRLYQSLGFRPQARTTTYRQPG